MNTDPSPAPARRIAHDTVAVLLAGLLVTSAGLIGMVIALVLPGLAP